MDLKIADRTAIVCASSRGLGFACAHALAQAGVRVVMNGRDPDRLAAAADMLRTETGGTVIAVAGDLSTEAGRTALLSAVPHVDILVNNNGGPPAADFRTVDRAAMLAGLEANMVAPAMLVRAVVDGMIERRFGRIVDITSGSVRMPLAGLDLSSGARAGLTGYLAGIARSVAHANVTINHLLPGSFDTDRIAALTAKQAEARGRPAADILADRIAAIPARRLGTPAEFGAACAFLCSDMAGYITGQSLLLDGGVFPGIF